jgi:polysaccharide export outer membrane protein
MRTASAPEPLSGSIPANLPALPVGNNDLLIISVYDAPELSRSVRVSSDGFIRLPMLKQRIQAEGMLPSQIEQTISASLVEEGILVDPVVTVSIAEYHSRPVSVAGAVRTPVTFQAAGPLTLLQAIAKAGGLEKNAGTEILVTRATETLHVPVKALIEATEPRWNVTLRGGEEIRVPEAGRIFVAGNVKKPGAFLSSELTDATVLKAVAFSEGLLPYSARQAFIYRPDGNGSRMEIALNLTEIIERKSPDVELQPEDLLYIPDNKGKKRAAITLEKILAFGGGATTALIYAGVR